MSFRLRSHITRLIACIVLIPTGLNGQVTASFSALTNQGCSPFIATFLDQSSGSITSWEWDFGNGSTSFLQNPSTSYVAPGSYTVTLTVSNSTDSDTLTFTNYITVFSNPSADFHAVGATVGCVPFTVDFLDLSVPANGAIASWLWDFGDGTISTLENPTHTFYLDGTFTISLEIEDVNGCKDFTTVPNLVATTDPPEVAFTANQTFACEAPISVTFTNQTTGSGPISYLWDFGDGDTSGLENPVHNYTSQGTFDVTLIATDVNNCSDTLEKLTYITIQNYVADFDINIHEGCLMPGVDTFEFDDQSGPFTSNYLWDFGDGFVSGGYNPNHVYQAPGIYTIRLISGNIFCSDTAWDTVYVQQLDAGFDIDTFFSCNPPALFNFMDTGFNASSWEWHFGDGDTSHEQNPAHTYFYEGEFDIDLFVQNTIGCEDTVQDITVLIDVVEAEIGFDTLSGCIPVSINLGDNSASPSPIFDWQWFMDDSLVSDSSTFQVTFNDTGAYDMTLIVVDSLGCKDTTTILASAGIVPTGSYTVASDTICAGSDAIFYISTDIANNYLWYYGNGDSSFAFENPHYHSYEDTGYFVTTFIPFHYGCPGDTFAADTGTYAGGPIAAGSVVPNCDNVFEFQFLDQSIDATGWYWDFGDGDTSGLPNVMHVYAVKDQYEVLHVVYNSNTGCIDSINLDVNITVPQAIFTISDTVGCNRLDNVSFDGSAAIDGQWAANFWSFGNGLFLPDTNNPDSAQLVAPDFIDYDTAGIYTVTFRVTDVNGCVDSAFREIRIYKHDTRFAITYLDSCVPVNVLLFDSTQADTTITSWHWSFGDGDTSVTQNPGHLYPNPGDYTLTLTTTDAAGCTDQQDVSIAATDPQAYFINTTPYGCIGDFQIFANLSTGVGLTYQWNFGDGTGSSNKHPIKAYSYADSFTVQLVVTDYLGCTDTFTEEKLVTIRDPMAMFLVSDTFSPCPPLLVSFTDQSQLNITQWMWDLGDSTFSADPNPQHNYTEPGIYTIILSLEDDLGCTATDTFPDLIEIGGPSADVLFTPDSGCFPLAVTFRVENKVDVGTVIWDFGDGTVATGDTITHVYDSSGTFTPIAVLSNGLQGQQFCDVVEILDPVYINHIKAAFVLSSDSGCRPAQITITDVSENASAWNWNFNGDSSSSASNPGPLLFDSAGAYSLTLETTSSYGCTDEVTRLIRIYDNPVVASSGSGAVCEGESLQLLASFDPEFTYLWVPADGLNDNTLFNPLASPFSTTQYVVEVTNEHNCKTVSDTVTIRIQNKVALDALRDTIIFTGEMARLWAVTNQQVYSYQWVPPATLTCDQCSTTLAQPPETQTYQVTVVDSNDCFAVSDQVTVTVKDDIMVSMPDAFSPNGDGINDVIFVGGYGIMELIEFSIYNRWGELVFRSNDLAVGWDGSYRGSIQNVDSYAYYIKARSFSNKIREIKGSFSLLK